MGCPKGALCAWRMGQPLYDQHTATGHSGPPAWTGTLATTVTVAVITGVAASVAIDATHCDLLPV